MLIWLYIVLPISCFLFLFNFVLAFNKIREGKGISILNVILASIGLYLMIFIPSWFIALEAGRV